MQFNFNYIEENLNRIIQNPDSVLYLRPYDIRNKRALFVVVKEEQGLYRKIQITKEVSKMIFPFEPLYWFYNGPGCFFLKDFICFNNILALNSTNLDGFIAEEFDERKIVGIFAIFEDGSATFVIRKSKKRFEKQGGLQPYIDLLRQYKEYESNYDTYEIIECYSTDGDTFVIPKLQEKIEEHQKVKKLTLTRKDD